MCLDDVLINDQLLQREARPAQLDVEITALQQLMQAFSKDSGGFLHAVVETACQLCGGDSAGISQEEPGPGDTKVVRWIAATGLLREIKDQTMPRDLTPCGTVMDRNSPQLFQTPSRFFTSIPPEYAFEEGLLVPWRVNNTQVGTLWVMSHRNGRHFDREDLRMLESLRAFAQAAVWKDQVETERRAQGERDASARMANDLAHQINNPLQALTNSLHMLSCEDHPEVLREAQAQLDRISGLVRGILALSSGAGVRG